MKNLSIYVHIPFCVQKCIYCNFVSFTDKNSFIENYFAKLKQEITQNSLNFKDYVVLDDFERIILPSTISYFVSLSWRLNDARTSSTDLS